MSRCKQCNVIIKDDTEICPLCHTVMEKSGSTEDFYPDVMRKNRVILLLIRIYLFVAIVAEVLLVIWNLHTYEDTFWAIIPAGIFLYIYLTLLYTFGYARSGYMMKMFVAVLLLIGILIVIDQVMGGIGWARNYVFPALLMVLDAAVLLLVIINRRAWYSYLSVQLVLVLLSLVPVLFVRLGLITRPTLTYIALLCAVFSFLGTLIIGGQASVDELKRRFHL